MKINVTKSSMPSYYEYIEEIKDIWDSHWLTNMGRKHNELEKQLQDFLAIPYVSLTVNGHNALELALQALELTGEVITTPFTFASTTHAIVRNNLTPIFCDITLDDYTMDSNKIESLITDKTCAILPVHVYGSICDIEKIETIARKHNLKVIYDAAHTFGECYKGKSIVSYGDISILSFHATKVFHTIEGGAICYHDSCLKERIHQLRDFGIRDEENVDMAGTNAKMNEFCAAMGLCNLRHIKVEIEKRKRAVDRYKMHLNNVPGLHLPKTKQDVTYNYAYFPVYFDEEIFGYSRDEIHARLKEKNIFSRKYFFPLTNTFNCYKNQYSINDTPVAFDVSKKILTLPLYSDLQEEVIDQICEIILTK